MMDSDALIRISKLAKLAPEKIEKMKYEEAMILLDEVVEAMEEEGTPLELGLQLYESGMALSKKCGKILDETEERMIKILETTQGQVEEEFDPTRGDQAGGNKH